MTFTELATEIKDRLGYTSTTADTRVGRLINKIYRQVGTEIGLNFSRQTNATKVVTIGNAQVTFSAIERIDRVWYEDSSATPHILKQVLIDELRNVATPSNDKPKSWALLSTASNTVTIRLDAKPKTAYTLNCDGVLEVADLAGGNEPAFSESFHDIIIEGVLREEYLKLEKPALSDRAEAAYEKRLSSLRMFMAKTGYMDIYPGKYKESAKSTSGGSSATLGSSALTITALWTFSRGTNAPFAVAATAAYVPNLYAEKLGNVNTDKLIGRDTAAVGVTEEIGVSGGIEFTGSTGIRTSAFTGDVTKAAGGTALTIAADAVTNAMIRNSGALSIIGRSANTAGDPADISAVAAGDAVFRESGSTIGFGTVATAGLTNNAVTYAKVQDVTAASRLLGRGSALGSGDPEELTASGGVEISGTVVQTAAFTGDVTKTSGGTALTIAANAVANAGIRDSGALSVIGRSANSSGDPADISAVAAGDAVLRESGSTLGFGTVATAGIANDAVTYAKMQNISAASLILGRGSAAGSGDPQEITLGSGLSMSGTTISSSSGFSPYYHVSTAFEATGRFTITLVGGGTNTFGPGGAILNTSVTATSSTNVQFRAVRADNNGGVFSVFPTEFSCNLFIDTLGTDVQVFVGIGAPTVGGGSIDYTTDHIGFKVVRAASGTTSLFATQAGGTETASAALQTLLALDSVELSLKMVSTTSVDYYTRKNGGAWSAATNLSTNVPTTATTFYLSFAISNAGVATRTEVTLQGASFKR